MDGIAFASLASWLGATNGITMTCLAYLDAGTGSMLFQILIASIVSAGVVFGGVMARIRSFFSRVVLRRAEESSASMLRIHTADDGDVHAGETVSNSVAALSEQAQQRRAA